MNRRRFLTAAAAAIAGAATGAWSWTKDTAAKAFGIQVRVRIGDQTGQLVDLTEYVTPRSLETLAAELEAPHRNAALEEPLKADHEPGWPDHPPCRSTYIPVEEENSDEQKPQA